MIKQLIEEWSEILSYKVSQIDNQEMIKQEIKGFLIDVLKEYKTEDHIKIDERVDLIRKGEWTQKLNRLQMSQASKLGSAIYKEAKPKLYSTGIGHGLKMEVVVASLYPKPSILED